MSRRRVEFRPDAEAEARAARLWYLSKDASAADRFMTELDESVKLLAESPLRWPRYLRGTHRLRLRRFPYALVFRVTGEVIQVIAVAHDRRKPGYWSQRP